jgi:hypothetical protein
MTAKLHQGDPAFDFTLPRLDPKKGRAHGPGKAITLRSCRGRKPVALIFGSYT